MIWKLCIGAATAAVILPLVTVDLIFFSANLLKLLEGGWVLLLFGVAMAVTIWTWRRGSAILADNKRRIEVPLDSLIKSLEKRPPHLVKGTAVFLTRDPNFAPTARPHNLKHNKVLQRAQCGSDHRDGAMPCVDVCERVHMERISDKLSYASASWSSQTCPMRWLSPASLAGNLTSCRHSFFVSRRALKTLGAVGQAGTAGPPVYWSIAVGQ